MTIPCQQHLRVRRGGEFVAEAFEFIPQLNIVIDLAIKNDPIPAILAGHGLMPANGKVQNGKTTKSQCEGIRLVVTACNIRQFQMRVAICPLAQ